MWILPSLSRPDNLRRFFAACQSTETSSPGVVLIDREDYAKHKADYASLAQLMPFGWTIRQTIGVTQGDKIREVWPSIKDSSWLGLIGDDCVPETRGWDQLLIERLDGWNIVSCNDDWQAPRRLANCWIMAGNLVREAGFIFPSGMHHLCVDDVWEEIGREAECWDCRLNVMVRHRHVLKGDAAPDETHRAVYGGDQIDRSRGMWQGDIQCFEIWKLNYKADLIERIKKARAHLPKPALPIIDADEQRARMQHLRSRSVLILTPIHGRPSHRYTLALAATTGLLMSLGIKHKIQFMTGSANLPLARNTLIAHFLMQPEYSDAMLIDADMGWDPNSLLRLLTSEHDVIAGVGRKKMPEPNSHPAVWCVRLLGNAGSALTQDKFNAIEVHSVGTGFLKVTRKALEKIIAARPDLKAHRPGVEQRVCDNYYRFFRFGLDPEAMTTVELMRSASAMLAGSEPMIGRTEMITQLERRAALIEERKGDETGEDYSFCELWRSLGGRIWIDPDIYLQHDGDHNYGGAFSEMLIAAAPEVQRAAE